MKNFPAHLQDYIDRAQQAQITLDTVLSCYRSVDLTSLNSNDTVEKIKALAARSSYKNEHVAALCVYPPFIPTVVSEIGANSPIEPTTVINFHDGKGTPEETEQRIKRSLNDGAKVFDIVMDHESFIARDYNLVGDILQAAREASRGHILKTIIETAAYDDYHRLHDACHMALVRETDFLKTSTGKHPLGGATPEAAAVLLEALQLYHAYDAGAKISGGVKKTPQAVFYHALAELMKGKGWATPDHFRIGASDLVDDLVMAIEKLSAPQQSPVIIAPRGP